MLSILAQNCQCGGIRGELRFNQQLFSTPFPFDHFANSLYNANMKKWNITSQDPGEFTLVADARSTHTDYVNDHIWEIRYRHVEPPALTIQTTYGLRALSFRIFPRFLEGETVVVDPANFDIPLVIHNFGPNFVFLSYSPLPGIMVEAYYWVPDSHVMGGRMIITNNKLQGRELRFELAAILSPDENGHRMVPHEIEKINVLTGKAHNLHPVLFITGGAEEGTGPYPSLASSLELAAGMSREFTWAVAALEDEVDSFQLARATAKRAWDGEMARAELLAESQIIIQTGDPDWDTAFALSQKTALGLLVSPTAQLPHASFVVNRLPHQGFSSQGTGQDYQLNWSGQTPLQTDYLSGLIAVTTPEFAQGLLMNFFAFQREDGFVPKKIGLAGQKSDLLAMPVLGNMAWRIYQITQSEDFLREVFPRLRAFVQGWLSPEQDNDQDGIPEWTRGRQSGFEEHPDSISNPNWALSPDVSMMEEPALCALLVNELKILIRMAGILKNKAALPELEAMKAKMEKAIHESWDEETAIYYRWDKYTHFSPAGEVLATGTGPGIILAPTQFEHPVRLLIQIEADNLSHSNFNIFIHGSETTDKHWVEQISSAQFSWHMSTGKALSLRVYSSLEYVDVYKVEGDVKVTVHVADFRAEDISAFLPLWCGTSLPENAKKLIAETLTNPKRFWRPYGLLAALASEHPTVHMPWNAMVGRGLLAYGDQDTAAKLVSKLMNAIIKNLKESGSFYTCYDAETGQGLQERNTVDGLAPLELFLETLGVRILSPRKFAFEGKNPFPWPVTIKYRGVTIVRRKRRTTITFPDGQTVAITTPKPRVVSLTSMSVS